MNKQEKESFLRESILNWYEFLKDSELLELSVNGESLKNLFERRCSSVCSVDFSDFDAVRSKRFDYVVSLEGIEYADDPVSYVRKCMECLKPGGRLLLGAENRYGLKYFCGAGDKHTGLPFDGINGYFLGEGKSQGKSYSRKELCNVFKQAGCLNYKFYYPVPDGRMPQMIFSDDYQKGINAAERLVDYNYEDPSIMGVEHRIFAEMVDDGALPFMSNYFLVEISKGDSLSDIQYAVVTTDRGRDRAMATTIHSDKTVHKRPIWKEGSASIKRLYQQTKELIRKGVPVVDLELKKDDGGEYLCMPFVDSEGLSSVLEKLSETDVNRFIKVFDMIFENIKKSYETNDKRGRVFLDLAPCNAFFTGDGINDDFVFYDQEFVSDDASLEFAMFRTIKYFFASSPKARANISENMLYRRYQITDIMLEVFEKEEDQFIKEVRNMDQNDWLIRLATPDYRLIRRNMYRSAVQSKKYRIGYVPGVYDLFHSGHLKLFTRCKERCEYLIVGVLTDELVEFYKGKKPVISYEDRAEVIRGLKVVDEVIPVDFSNTDKIKAWEQLHYDCHFSGDDHVGHWNDVHEELKKRGSNMEFFPYTQGISSTDIKSKMQR